MELLNKKNLRAYKYISQHCTINVIIELSFLIWMDSGSVQSKPLMAISIHIKANIVHLNCFQTILEKCKCLHCSTLWRLYTHFSECNVNPTL